MRRVLHAVVPVLGAVLGVAGMTGCGGGSASNHVGAPLVRQFSPTISPIDFNTLQQNPTFTDQHLTVSTDPQYPGEIVVFFQSDTEIDPSSIFLGGDPQLGIDPNAVVVLHFIPGTGNVQVDLVKAIVEKDRIRLFPNALWNLDMNGNPVADAAGVLDLGQYSIGVFSNVRNTHGHSLQEAPVFQSFTVGAVDVDGPTVLSTSPVDQAKDVGAGAPPPDPSQGSTAQGIADVRTNVFGPTSPVVTVRFNEGIASSSVTVNNVLCEDAGAFVPGGGAPPQIAPAPGYPKLKSVEDGATLPSNGHEIIWKADPTTGGFPFGTTIRLTLTGLYNDAASEAADPLHMNPQNQNPLRDLAGNGMLVNFTFSFQTIAPPSLPQNPFPEYSVWWSGTDRVGVIDTINQQALADQFTGAKVFPQGIPRNVIPQYADTVATSQVIPKFDPTEISLDCRTHPTTCHSFVYVISPSSGQVLLLNSRNALPVALINTPTPGGITNCTGPESTGGNSQAANIMIVTNSSANTYTIFDISHISPGTTFLNGPITIQKVVRTGNTPRAIAITTPSTANFHRDGYQPGPKPELIMWADLTDGVVNVSTPSKDQAVRKFNLGPTASPNDVALTPCLGNLLFGAISEGGDGPLKGKIAYYASGPGCSTGSATPAAPDSLVGDLTGFDAPAGLDDTFNPPNTQAFFAVAESGSQANALTLLGLETGANNLPRVISRFKSVGQNPTNVCHADAYIQTPCIAFIPDPLRCNPTHSYCWYNGTKQKIYQGSYVQAGLWWDDATYAASLNLFVCARGSGRVIALNEITGFYDVNQPPAIPGVRFVATHATE